MPAVISVQVAPASRVRKMCGRRSSSRSVLTAAYAVSLLKWLASRTETFQNGFGFGGGVFFQGAAAILRDVNQAIIGSNPNAVHILNRRRHGINHPPLRRLRCRR